MEKENNLPTDVGRRLVIAAMLNIPLADLGIRLSQAGKKQPLIPLLTEETVIDVAEYRKHLALLWSSKYDKAEEAMYRINLLEDALHYGPQSDKLQVAELLCEYLIFWSNVEHRSVRFSLAINMVNKAIQVAEDRNLLYIAAKAHYMRGSIAYDRWPTSSQRNQGTLTNIITEADEIWGRNR